MITAAEIVRIQRDVAAVALSLPCVIQRKNVTQGDGFGSNTETWPVISPANLMCGLSEPSGGQLQNYDYLIATLSAWQVKLPVGTDVLHQDRLIILNQILVVQVVLYPKSYATLLTALASRLD